MFGTMSFHDELGGGWREILRSIVPAWLNIKATKRSRGKATSAASKEIAELQKAILTFRMAANPGESYEVVAARIEREAAIYKAFLQKPGAIGKIILNVKQLDSKTDDVKGSHRQYQVNEPSTRQSDPSEGRACVSYTFNRSNNKVLEFMVYDEDDNPLFPIVRTYSDWVGSREFDLGLNRTFCLNMTESESPGYVIVEAGFRPAASKQNPVHAPETDAAQPLAARTVHNAKQPENRPNAFMSSYGKRLACVVGLECLAISLVCCLIFWGAVAKRAAGVEPLSKPSHGAATQVAGAKRDDVPPGASELSPATAEQQTADTGGDDNSPASALAGGAKARPKSANPQKTRRMAEIKELGILVNSSACQKTESRCRELLTNYQKEMESKLSRLNLPASLLEQSDAVRKSVKLIVSFEPVDGQHGHIYLTLYDGEGCLWEGEGDCYDYGEKNLLQFVSASSNKSSEQLVEEINRAKEQVNSEGKQSRAEAFEKGGSLLTD